MAAVNHDKNVLIVGASRGLGFAMAEEFIRHGWRVTGTVREEGGNKQFHKLAQEHPGRVRVEGLDICKPEQIGALHDRLSESVFDILFVNAGTTNRDPTQTIGEVSTEEFMHVMLTNALSPMRVIESLEKYVAATGLIGVMSSGQGSITNNTGGQRELYRGTKAALNMFMRSFAARQAGSARAMVVMAPGWIKTDLGGADAPLTVEETIPSLVNVLLKKQDRPGLEYLDYLGRTVPW
ncbi:MAG: SDR family oxidoreductase [Advenella sp.]|uniref:3-oxoacyl-ACP reductase n=1 Tax=Advenella kashmirensis TaxID=310575 RepID=A0A356LLL1_9BURK|nr:3-oxoacyl-ACP reductase [Advenella kashmirensis]